MSTEFNSLAFPKRPIVDLNVHRYYVYRDGKEYVAVEASSAVDAVKKSGVETPFKVKHEVAMRSYLLDFKELATKELEKDAPTKPAAVEASGTLENIPQGGIEAQPSG